VFLIKNIISDNDNDNDDDDDEDIKWYWSDIEGHNITADIRVYAVVKVTLSMQLVVYRPSNHDCQLLSYFVSSVVVLNW